jgi:hypothetical protein
MSFKVNKLYTHANLSTPLACCVVHHPVYHLELRILSTHYICVIHIILTIKKQFFSIWPSSTDLPNGSKMCSLFIIFSYTVD